MSNRRITNEQFVNSGAIDGSRIQTALDDTEAYINNVPLEAIRERFSLNYMVFTCLGPDTLAVPPTAPLGTGRVAPFLPSEGGGVPSHIKGLRRIDVGAPHLAPYDDGSLPFVFTVSTIFPRPVILDTVSLFINSLGAAGVGPGGFHSFDMWDGANASYQRVRIIIDTDDDVSSEDRTLNSKEYVIQNFQETFWSSECNTVGSQMSPLPSEGVNDWGVGPTQSIFLTKKNVSVPFHQFARVRFRIIFWQGPGTQLSQRTPENVTFTIVYKEALRDG